MISSIDILFGEKNETFTYEIMVIVWMIIYIYLYKIKDDKYQKLSLLLCISMYIFRNVKYSVTDINFWNNYYILFFQPCIMFHLFEAYYNPNRTSIEESLLRVTGVAFVITIIHDIILAKKILSFMGYFIFFHHIASVL